MEKNIELIQPYGGRLTNLVVQGDERVDLLAQANHYPSLQISDRNLNDLELLATGGFSPLDRFMGEGDYKRVLSEMRLQNGLLFPLPITLTIKRMTCRHAMSGLCCVTRAITSWR